MIVGWLFTKGVIIMRDFSSGIYKLLFGSFFDLCWKLYGPDEFAFAALMLIIPYVLTILMIVIFLCKCVFSFGQSLSYAIRRYYWVNNYGTERKAQYAARHYRSRKRVHRGMKARRCAAKHC